jgi:hypothetical protein
MSAYTRVVDAVEASATLKSMSCQNSEMPYCSAYVLEHENVPLAILFFSDDLWSTGNINALRFTYDNTRIRYTLQWMPTFREFVLSNRIDLSRMPREEYILFLCMS